MKRRTAIWSCNSQHKPKNENTGMNRVGEYTAKLIYSGILILLVLGQAAIAQEISPSQPGCSLIDKSRDPLFITYERLDDPDPKREGTDRDRVLVRLHNNSTCNVNIETTEAEKFYRPVPPNPTGLERVKRVYDSDLPDGAIVPAVKFYTQDLRRTKSPKPAWGGDMFFKFCLLGGNSMLFAIPMEYLKKGNNIVVPFEYAWETAGPSHKLRYSGDVEQHVYFFSQNIPDEIKRKILGH